MADFAGALERINRHGEKLFDDSMAMLKQIVQETCDAISAAEGSILVPTACGQNLRFFVSINPSLDGSDITFPCDESISGYVFSSRQAMAKIKPDSAGSSLVDEISKSKTEFLLAVPIVDDDQVYGVATFVNRTGSLAETPFSAHDLEDAQAFGEIYATAMKLHRQTELSMQMARREVADHACVFGLHEMSRGEESEEIVDESRLPLQLVEKAVALPLRERELLIGFADLLAEHAYNSEEEDSDDL